MITSAQQFVRMFAFPICILWRSLRVQCALFAIYLPSHRLDVECIFSGTSASVKYRAKCNIQNGIKVIKQRNRACIIDFSIDLDLAAWYSVFSVEESVNGKKNWTIHKCRHLHMHREWKTAECICVLVHAKWECTMVFGYYCVAIEKKWSKWYAHNEAIHLKFLMKILPNVKFTSKLLSERMKCAVHTTTQIWNKLTKKNIFTFFVLLLLLLLLLKLEKGNIERMPHN